MLSVSGGCGWLAELRWCVCSVLLLDCVVVQVPRDFCPGGEERESPPGVSTVQYSIVVRLERDGPVAC